MAEDAETPGIWTKTYENFEVNADNAGMVISFKAVANHNYSIGEVPQGEGNNATLTLPEETGIYNITLTLNTGDWTLSNEIVKVGGEEPEPEAADLYFRGTIAGCGWYDGAATAEDAGIDPKWKGTTTDGKVYTWDWSAEPIALADGNQFKIGAFVADNWAGQAYGIAGGAAFAVGEAFAVEIPGGNIGVTGDYSIASATLDTEAGTLLLVAAEEEEPVTDYLMLYGGVFGMDANVETYLAASEEGVYTWNFDGGMEVSGWFLITGRMEDAENGGYTQDWSKKVGSSEQISIAEGSTEATINAVADGTAGNIVINGTLNLTQIVYNSVAGTLTVYGSQEAEAGPAKLYFRGDANNWLDGMEEGEVAPQWMATDEDEDGIFVWDWSALETEAATITGEFQIADWYYNEQYGAAEAGAVINAGEAFVATGKQNISISETLVVSKITLNTNDKTILIEAEEQEPEPVEPVVPTADSYVVEWSKVYDAEAGTLTLTAKITAAADAGFTMDQITGAQAEIIYGDGTQTSGRIDINADNGFTASYTIPDIQPGSTVDYSLKIVTGGNDVVGGSDVSGIAPDSYIVPDGEEPEPVPAAWYIAGNGDVDAAWVGGLSWDVAGVALADNGDGTYGYETTVPAGTYQFKITNGKWYDPENTPDGINYGYTNIDAVASTSGYVDGGGNNVMFTIASEATITITLNPAAMDDAKIILSSTVGFGEAVVDRWTLAGDVPFFAGSAWGFDAGNDLVETAPGVWTKVYENVEVTSDMAGQTYLYKVGANGGFDVDQYPAQGNNTFTMPAEAGSYNITFTFNAEGERTLDFECVMNEPTSIDEAAAAVITAADGRIYCDKDFVIVNLAGQDVTAANGNLQGTYLVVAGDEVVKVMVD